MTRLRTTFLPLIVFTVFSPLGSLEAHDGAAAMSEAARNLIASLDADEKAKMLFPWDSDERRNWHFIPKARNGLPFKEMKKTERRHLAFALLSTGLSHGGYQKALTIMSLEQVLHELENNSPTRDPDAYFVSIFGEPGADNTWGWRFEGHHLSLNFTIIKGKKVSATPSFLGANPGIIKGERRRAGLRTLGVEEDLARDLVTSLDADQRKEAVMGNEAPRDIVTAAERKVSPLEDKGVGYSALNDDQKRKLERLVDEYVTRNRPAIAEDDWKRIREAGMDKIRFVWSGPTEVGAPHYYRVQGATFIMEFANTQNEANHPHSVWRDFNGDFGEDILARHLAEEH